MGPDINKLLDETNDGLVQYGKYIYTKSAIRFVWLAYIQSKKGSFAYRNLVNAWKAVLNDLFTATEYGYLKDIFNVKGKDQVLSRLSKDVLPSYDAVQRLVQDLGHQVALPLVPAINKALAKLGTHVLSSDMTFDSALGIVNRNGGGARMGVLTVKDEWTNYAAYDLIPNCKETHYYVVPVLAKLVYQSLYYGKYRDEGFLFCTDHSQRDKNVPSLVFQHVIDEYNDGNAIFRNISGEIYNLQELSSRSRVALDTLHVHLRITKAKVINKEDAEKRICKSGLNFILKNVNTKWIPTILNGKFTAFEWYDEVFCETYKKECKRLEIEDNLRLLIQKLSRLRLK